MAHTRWHRRIGPVPFVGRRGTGLALGGVAIGLIAAGCGGGTSTHTSTPAAAQTAKSAVISTFQAGADGTVLVSGNTLYILKSPSQTACAEACLKIWPELLLPAGMTAAVAGPGVDAAKLGTLARGSALQVTYGGQPLYYFSEDKAPGQVNGNVTDVWGTWADVVVSGNVAAASGATSTSQRSSSTSAAPAGPGTPVTTAKTSPTATTPTSAASPTTKSPMTTASTTPTTRTSATTAAPPTTAPTTTAPPQTTTTPAPTTTTTAPGGGGGF